MSMRAKETGLFAFFDFPIEQLPGQSTRWLLEDKESVRGLLETIADNLAGNLDFSHLTHINRSFIPYNLREQASDILYSVPFRTESKTNEVFIYILIERRSNVEATIAFDMLLYMTQIWEFQCREWESNNTPKSQRRLRPIIPIVFCEREQRWQIPLDLSTLIDLPDMFSGFIEMVAERFAKINSEGREG